jgi:hypothetical protein
VPLLAVLLALLPAFSVAQSENAVEEPKKEAPAVAKPKAPADPKPAAPANAKPETAPEAKPETAEVDPDDEAAMEDAAAVAVAIPVNSDPVQVYGWREDVMIDGMEEALLAKLDSGALTSSIHAEETELFERDGKKWVRFIVTDTRQKNPVRARLEAPLVRIARIKEPNAESVSREVVRLSFKIGDRKVRGEFTLNNRNNMLAPVLLGRSVLKDLGWVDSTRTHIADQKIFR